MNHKERVLKALSHEETDRVPIDLGSSENDTLHVEFHKKLKEFFNIHDEKETIVHKFQQVVLPHEQILSLFDVDLRGVWLDKPDRSTEIDYPNGSYKDEWGVIRKKPENCYYYDLEYSPFDMENLTLDDIENFEWPDPSDLGRIRNLKKKVKKLWEENEYAIVFNFGAPPVHKTQFLRGFQRWYEDLLLRPALIEAMFEKVVNFYIEIGKLAFKEIGEYIDIVMVADDLGTQNGLQFSPRVYRQLIKPYHAKLFSFIHSQTKAKLAMHSCGSIRPVIRDLIEIGVDVLNPVQVMARDMNIEQLKKEFGNELCFWGAIDTQKILSFGTEEEVKNHVKKTISILGRRGGYILSPSHNISPGDPVENIVTMYETVLGRKLIYAKKF